MTVDVDGLRDRVHKSRRASAPNGSAMSSSNDYAGTCHVVPASWPTPLRSPI